MVQDFLLILWRNAQYNFRVIYNNPSYEITLQNFLGLQKYYNLICVVV